MPALAARITGTGHYLPKRVVSNAELAAICGADPEWIRTRTGIEARHYAAPGETASVMGTIAAERALGAARRQVSDVDAILFATLSPDYTFPGCACLVQSALGGPPIAAYDLRNQCAGFVYGLQVADALIRAGVHRCVLLIGAELQSTGLDFSPAGRDLAVLFGDGAGAVVLEACAEDVRGVVATQVWAEGAHARELWCEGPASSRFPQRVSPDLLAEGIHLPRMNGRTVFRHAVTRMRECTQGLLDAAGLEVAAIDFLVPHQANQRITELLGRMLEIAPEKVLTNIALVGNTTAASIPIALDQAVAAGRIFPGALLALVAFGSGFTWGGALLRWSAQHA